MAVPDQELVCEVLNRRGRGSVIHDALARAWDAVTTEYDTDWFRRRSTRASLVWEHAVQNAVDALDGDPGVEIVGHHDTLSFVFDGRVLLRFKKADLRLRTSAYPTGLAEAFHDHAKDLFGFSGLQRVEAVYVLGEFGAHVSWIGVVARLGKRLLWQLPLDGEGASIEQPALPETVQPAADVVLRIKDEEADDAGANGRESAD